MASAGRSADMSNIFGPERGPDCDEENRQGMECSQAELRHARNRVVGDIQDLSSLSSCTRSHCGGLNAYIDVTCEAM